MTAEEKAAELYPYAATGTIHWAQQVLKQQGFISGANWQASQHEWVKCSERLPTEADAVDGEIEIIHYLLNGSWKKLLVFYERVSEFQYYVSPIANLHWRTPLANNFPEPPKTEI
jgi:hypothetical protein